VNVQFSMQDGAKEIACAISTSAMDDFERGPRVRPSEREEQFTRLRERIESCTGRKYQATEFEGTPPGSCCGALIFGVGGEPQDAGETEAMLQSVQCGSDSTRVAPSYLGEPERRRRTKTREEPCQS
jgi:hypothetical protein